jgi:hypothetical protein
MKPYVNNSVMSSFKRMLKVKITAYLVELLNLNFKMKQFYIGTTYTEYEYISEVKMFLPRQNYLLVQP